MTRTMQVRGVIAAIPTPFSPDGREIDEAALRGIVRHVVDGGVHGIMTTGGTGEFPHLTRSERKQVTQVVVDETSGAVPIYAGTAACSTSETIVLSDDAARVGATASIVTPPYYFPVPEEMTHEHMHSVAQAGVLPLVAYNNPLYTGNPMSPALISGLMKIDGVIGLKQSEVDLGQLVETIRLSEGSGRSLLTGIDSQFYAALCVGAAGIFSTAAAIVPSFVVRLYEFFRKGNRVEALETHRRLQRLNRFLEYDPGYVSPTKEALSMLGIPCGPVRRPLPDFPADQRPGLQAALDSMSG